MKTTAPQPLPRSGRVRILLCGYGHLGLAILDGLLACAEDCEVVGVFRWSSRAGSHSFWEPVEGLFQKRVAEMNLVDIRCQGMNSYEFAELLQQLQPDVVLVGSWGEILRPHLLDEAEPLIINCHPSKLPAHRGANPYSSVIREGETETGVTFHRMAPKIDAGAIILQRAFPLTADMDGAIVRDQCAATAQEMIPDLVQILKTHILHDSPLPEAEQNHAEHSYFPQLKPEDGAIHWENSLDRVHQKMRALFPWIASYSMLQGHRIVLFYDPHFVQGDPQGKAPGTILNFRRGVIQIALADPHRVLEVSAYQFARLLGPKTNAYWPVWLCRWLAPFILVPGHRFVTPRAN
jgi:methionyl-tRNA formyltransferase